MGKRKLQKNSKKIQQIEKYHYDFIPSQSMLEKAEKERKKKIIALFRSFPTGKRKFQKNSRKIEKIEKYYYGFIPSQKRGENAEKERK